MNNARVIMTKDLWKDLKDVWGIPFPTGYTIEKRQDGMIECRFKSYLYPLVDGQLHDVSFHITKSMGDINGSPVVDGFTIKFKPTEYQT